MRGDHEKLDVEKTVTHVTADALLAVQKALTTYPEQLNVPAGEECKAHLRGCGWDPKP